MTQAKECECGNRHVSWEALTSAEKRLRKEITALKKEIARGANLLFNLHSMLIEEGIIPEDRP